MVIKQLKLELKSVLRDLQDKNTRLRLLEQINFVSENIDERISQLNEDDEKESINQDETELA